MASSKTPSPLLLQDSPFPNFDRVQAEHVVPGIHALLAQLGGEIDDLELNVAATWQGLIDPLERISDRLSRAWGTISHLKAVKDTEALRTAYEEARPCPASKVRHEQGHNLDCLT